MAAKAQPRPHLPPRFFVSPDQFSNGRVDLPLAVTQQLQQVLRRKAGDSIIVLDNSGWEYEVELLHLDRRAGEGEVKQKRPALPEPKLKLHLYPALLKGEKLEWLLQKGTELGIAGFCPVVCQRSLVKEVSPTKIERWQRIIQEAAEQSGRGRLPSLAAPLFFEHAWEEIIDGPALIPWEGETVLGLKAALEKVKKVKPNGSSLNLFIGPEGGFEAHEIAWAQRCGGIVVSLGQRLLRAETAALSVAAVLLFHWGELGG